MKNLMKFVAVLFIGAGVLMAQDKTDTPKHDKENHEHMMKDMPDSCMAMMKKMHSDMSDSGKMKHKMMDMKNMPDSCKAMMKNMDMKDMSKCKEMMKDKEGMDHEKMMKNHKGMDHKKMMKDNKGMDHDKMMKEGGMEGMHSLIRKGVIDVEAIDENKDGKVFQDVMDWNVISDKAGACPICEMKLKEVTIEKAKDNLVKHGFKVK